MRVLPPRPVVAGVAGLVLSLCSLALSPAVGATERTVEYCTLSVIGVNEDGSSATGPLQCQRTTPSQARGGVGVAAVVAAHYDGANFSGSVLVVSGGSCSGWLNLPAAWQDRIASTSSACTTRHYRDINRQGTVELTFGPGGNLATLADQVSSVGYS